MAFFIVAIVVLVIAIALQPTPPGSVPPSLEDIDAPTAEQGRPIAKVFGTYVVQSPNIVWYGELGYTEIESEGGK